MPRSRTYKVVQEVDLIAKDKGYSKVMKSAAGDAEHLNKHMSSVGKAFQTVGVHGVGRGFGDLKNSVRFFMSGNISAGVFSLGRSIDGLNASGRGAAAGVAVLVAGIGGLVTAGIYATKKYQQLGSQLAQFQRVGGLSGGQALSTYGQMRMAGADLGSASKMLGMFAKNVEMARQGTGKQALAMKSLGISLKGSNGEWKTTSQLLPEVRNKIAGTTDAATRAFAAQTMFGRGWQTLGKWFNVSAKKIEQYNKIVEQSGFKWSDKDKGGLSALVESQRKVSLQWDLMWASFGKAMAPVMTKLTAFFSTWVPKIARFLWDIKVPLAVIVSTLAGMMIITKVLEGWGRFTTVIRGATAATTVTNAAEATNTALVKANTAALWENSSARAFNSRLPGPAGVAPTLASYGTGAGGGAAAAGGVSAGVASAAITGAAVGAGAAVYFLGYKPYKEALDLQQEATEHYVENVSTQIDKLSVKFGDGSAQISTYAGIVNKDLSQKFGTGHQNWFTRVRNWAGGPLGIDEEWKGLSKDDKRGKAIVDEITKILDRGPVTAGSATEDRLRKLYDELNSIKGPSAVVSQAIAVIGDELEQLSPGALLSVGDALKKVAEEAKAAAAEIKDSILGSATTVFEAVSQLAAKGIRLTGEELAKLVADMQAKQTAAAKELAKQGQGIYDGVITGPQWAVQKAYRDTAKIAGISYAEVVAAEAKKAAATLASKGGPPVYAKHDRTGQVGMRVPRLAAGGIVMRPTLALVGESGPEAVQPLKKSGTGAPLHVHINNLYGTDRAAVERFANQLGDVLSRKVRYANV